MPAPNRLVRSFSARLIWGSSTTRCPTSVASFFIQFNNPLWCITFGVIRYTTLPSRPSYWTFTFWCITFAVMHHHILPCRHTRVNSTSWDSPVRGPASITTFWFPADTRCLKTHPLTYRLIRWAPKNRIHVTPCAASSCTSGKTRDQLAHRSSR